MYKFCFGGLETSGECINFVLENMLSPEMFNNNQNLQTLFRGLANAYSFKLTGQIVRSGDQGLLYSFPDFIFSDGRLFGASEVLTNFGNPFPGGLTTIIDPRSLDGLTESTIPLIPNGEPTLTVNLDSAILTSSSIREELRPYTNRLSMTTAESLINAGYKAVDRGAQINGEIFFQMGSRLQELREEGIISEEDLRKVEQNLQEPINSVDETIGQLATNFLNSLDRYSRIFS